MNKIENDNNQAQSNVIMEENKNKKSKNAPSS